MSRRSGRAESAEGSDEGGRSAPLGVKVIAVVGGIGALLSIVGGVGAAVAVPLWGGQVLPLVLAAAVLGTVLGGAKLVALYGLVRLEPWGYKWTMWLYGLGLVLSLLSFGGGFVSLVFSLAVLGYLRNKRNLFEASPASTSTRTERTVRRTGPDGSGGSDRADDREPTDDTGWGTTDDGSSDDGSDGIEYGLGSDTTESGGNGWGTDAVDDGDDGSGWGTDTTDDDDGSDWGTDSSDDGGDGWGDRTDR